ncbi:uncharacterized protein METZ01_LOCUS435925, partial [marine metagenome]
LVAVKHGKLADTVDAHNSVETLRWTPPARTREAAHADEL